MIRFYYFVRDEDQTTEKRDSKRFVKKNAGSGDGGFYFL